MSLLIIKKLNGKGSINKKLINISMRLIISDLMIQANNVSLKFGKRTLFEDVNIKFTNGNCYGLIGANGAGKSTFLKLLAGEIETTTGEIIVSKNERVSLLRQDHYQYEDIRVLDVVIMGNSHLYDVMIQKDKMYQQTEFSEEDGMKLANLEAEFMDLDGWNAEPDASQLLSNLGIPLEQHYLTMKELPVKSRVKVLLAQALFGNPDILLLDEPTNSLDIESIKWLEELGVKDSKKLTDDKIIKIAPTLIKEIEHVTIVLDNKTYNSRIFN